MGGAFVMLDPTTSWVPPPDLLDAWVRRSVTDGVVVAGVLPVTDTVKELVPSPSGPRVGATHDREGLRRLVALVVPKTVLSAADGWSFADLTEALRAVRERHEVVLLSARPGSPPPGRSRRPR